MNAISQGYVIEEAIQLIDEYYKNNHSDKATIWQNDIKQTDSFQLRQDRIAKLYTRRSKYIEDKLADGDIPFPAAKYFITPNNTNYQIPKTISRGFAQLLAFEYIKPKSNTYPIFTTFCVDDLKKVYASISQPVKDQSQFLKINLEVLIGACTKHYLMIEPQDIISDTEAVAYDNILKQYPLQHNRFLIRLSAYYYMNLLFPVEGLRDFKNNYDKIIEILKSKFPDDYHNFNNSTPISMKASDLIYGKTGIAINKGAYLSNVANNEPQDYLIEILDSLVFE